MLRGAWGMALVVLTGLVLGCVTVSPTPRSEFEDIPVPRGLSYQAGRSTIIESPTVKAARLVYRGRIEPKSLAAAMRTTLEAQGWRHVSTAGGAPDLIQTFEKADATLQVRIWEGWWYTYLELTAGRPVALPR